MASVDRRVGKTVKSIRNALIAELKVTDPENITVSNLCRSADIGRGTFYTHYDGVHDVLQEIEDVFTQNIRDLCFEYFDAAEYREKVSVFSKMLEYVKQNEDTFYVFLYHPGSAFSERIEKQIYELFYYHDLKYRPGVDEVSVRFGVTAAICAAMGVIRSWFAGKMTEDVNSVAAAVAEYTGSIIERSSTTGGVI